MTTYRLPEILGGGEHEAADDTRGFPKVGFDLSGLAERLWLYRTDLTEVVPPLPEEPPVGTFVATGGDGNLLPFYRRWDEGWSRVGTPTDVTWAEICADSQSRASRAPVHLVPEPVVEPVTLPWHGKSIYSSPVEVSTGKEDPINVSVDGVSLAPDTADAMAAALTAAAAKARQTDA